jgi:hypothetical protein
LKTLASLAVSESLVHLDLDLSFSLHCVFLVSLSVRVYNRALQAADRTNRPFVTRYSQTPGNPVLYFFGQSSDIVWT